MLQKGTMIGTRYQVLGLLGQGGMSNIYVCQDTRLRGKTWVVKEMTARYSDPHEQSTALKYFEREAHLLANLHHPNLPTVNDYFQSNGKYYLVMEHIEGEDLSRMLTRVGGPLPERQVAEWGAQIATVLYYLHCQKPEPIIFRDVKPSNIMIAGAVVKLIDFGIARHFNPNKKGDTMRIGSPGYAPPEQYAGQTDPRSDVYALGVTMHQALTGRDPTTTQTPFHVPPVRSLNPKVSEEMARIIELATKIDPDERYQNMLDMKRDLQALVAQHRGGTSVVRSAPSGATVPSGAPAPAPGGPAPAPAKAPTPAARPQKATKRKGLPLARVAAVLMVLVSLGLGVAMIGSPGTMDILKGLLGYLMPPPQPVHTGGIALYVQGAPLADAFWELSRERKEKPDGADEALYWNNALAGLQSDRHLVVGAVVPEGEAWDPAVRGLAMGQSVLNGLGGVQDRLLVVVLHRAAPGHLAEAAARVASGQGGRQAEDARGVHGQAVQALLLFGEGEDLEKASSGSYPVPVVVASPLAGSASGGARILGDPAAPFAAAAAARAGDRAVVIFDPALKGALEEAGATVNVEDAPASVEDVASLQVRHGADLYLFSPAGLPEAALQALLDRTLEVLLVAETPRDLPAAPGEKVQNSRALVRLSSFHPWSPGADLARLYPVVFPSDGAEPPPPLATRAYDALRWMGQVSLGGEGEYRGATLAADLRGQASPAPLQVFEATSQGWIYSESLEAPDR